MFTLPFSARNYSAIIPTNSENTRSIPKLLDKFINKLSNRYVLRAHCCFQTEEEEMVQAIKSITLLAILCAAFYFFYTPSSKTAESLAYTKDQRENFNYLTLIAADNKTTYVAVNKLIKNARKIAHGKRFYRLHELLDTAQKHLSTKSNHWYLKPYFFIKKEDFFNKISDRKKKFFAIMAMATTQSNMIIITDNNCNDEFKALLFLGALTNTRHGRKYKKEVQMLGNKMKNKVTSSSCPNMEEMKKEFNSRNTNN